MGIPKRFMAAFGLALALATAGNFAGAQPSQEDKAAAEDLFQQAVKLMKVNKYEEACPKLESSNKLDPAVGTLFNLGDCYEHTGRTASAWSAFGEAKRMAERLKDRRVGDASDREKALESRLARVVISVDNKPDGLVIKRDKKPVDSGVWGSPIPVDPGKHTIEAEAPGREPWSTTIDVPDKAGETKVSVPPLEASRNPDTTPTASASASAAPDAGGLGTRKTIAIAVGGVGVAGLIAGGIFGGLTIAEVGKSNQDGHCLPGPPVTCDPTGMSIRQNANTFANVSNIALGVGAAATIAGVVLFVTAPSPAKTGAQVRLSPVIGAGMTGAQVSGSF